MSSPLNNKNIFGVGLNTTNATQTVAATIETFNDRCYVVEAVILATETDDHDEVASYGRVATFRNDGGTLTQVGTTTSLWTHEDTGGWDVDFNVNGENIEIRVTGAASTNVSWLVDAVIKNLGYVAGSTGGASNGGIFGEQS